MDSAAPTLPAGLASVSSASPLGSLIAKNVLFTADADADQEAESLERREHALDVTTSSVGPCAKNREYDED